MAQVSFSLYRHAERNNRVIVVGADSRLASVPSMSAFGMRFMSIRTRHTPFRFFTPYRVFISIRNFTSIRILIGLSTALGNITSIRISETASTCSNLVRYRDHPRSYSIGITPIRKIAFSGFVRRVGFISIRKIAFFGFVRHIGFISIREIALLKSVRFVRIGPRKTTVLL